MPGSEVSTLGHMAMAEGITCQLVDLRHKNGRTIIPAVITQVTYQWL